MRCLPWMSFNWLHYQQEKFMILLSTVAYWLSGFHDFLKLSNVPRVMVGFILFYFECWGNGLLFLCLWCVGTNWYMPDRACNQLVLFIKIMVWFIKISHYVHTNFAFFSRISFDTDKVYHTKIIPLVWSCKCQTLFTSIWTLSFQFQCLVLFQRGEPYLKINK